MGVVFWFCILFFSNVLLVDVVAAGLNFEHRFVVIIFAFKTPKKVKITQINNFYFLFSNCWAVFYFYFEEVADEWWVFRMVCNVWHYRVHAAAQSVSGYAVYAE